MKVDGKEIAKELREILAQAFATLSQPAHVTVFVVSEDEVTRQYLGIKEKTAKELGVKLSIENLSDTTSTQELIDRIKQTKSDGIIVQMPLPKHIDAQTVRDAIPRAKDIDCLGTDAFDDFAAGTGIVMPPVIAAIEHILRYHGVGVEEKNVVIIGRGRLVGLPAAIWCERNGAEVDIADDTTRNLAKLTEGADIIISGAGVPGLLTPEVVKEGAVIIDAGASEAQGKVVGDADPACAEKTSLFTPVPGGIGPVAIAMLFRNLYILSTDRETS